MALFTGDTVLWFTSNNKHVRLYLKSQNIRVYLTISKPDVTTSLIRIGFKHWSTVYECHTAFCDILSFTYPYRQQLICNLEVTSQFLIFNFCRLKIIVYIVENCKIKKNKKEKKQNRWIYIEKAWTFKKSIEKKKQVLTLKENYNFHK